MSTVTSLGPEWLAHRYDEATDQIRFAAYDRAERSAVPFLTDQYLQARPFTAMPRDEAKRAATATAPIHFIFHSGFCCSTLLAACLDQPGTASGFSEPMLLNDIAGWRKRGAPPAEVGRLLDEALTLLARPFAGDAAAVIKPSTVVNGLAAAMLRLRPESKAILIHAPLEDFLTSIAKKGLDGRLWARELFLAMRTEGLTRPLGFDDEAFFGQTDLQVAACDWLAQQALFAGLARSLPDRVRTIDSRTFLADPARAIERAAALFELPDPARIVELAAAGPLKRNSKDGSNFSREAREADYASASAAHGDEIGKVAVWGRAVAEAAGVSMELPNSLLAESQE